MGILDSVFSYPPEAELGYVCIGNSGLSQNWIILIVVLVEAVCCLGHV